MKTQLLTFETIVIPIRLESIQTTDLGGAKDRLFVLSLSENQCWMMCVWCAAQISCWWFEGGSRWFLVPFGRVINDAFLLCCQPFYGIDNLIEVEVKNNDEDSMPVWSFVLLFQNVKEYLVFNLLQNALFYGNVEEVLKVWEEVFYFESKKQIDVVSWMIDLLWKEFCCCWTFSFGTSLDWSYFFVKLKTYMMNSMNNI